MLKLELAARVLDFALLGTAANDVQIEGMIAGGAMAQKPLGVGVRSSDRVRG